MSNTTTITDRRLLAALDYIDQKYIDDAFSIIKEPDTVEGYIPGRRSPLKHWKQFVALAACLILLSVASPLVSYIAGVISNFTAGAGSGITEESSVALDYNTEKDMLFEDYLNPIQDLEPLPESLIGKYPFDEINTDINSNRYLGRFSGYYVLFCTSYANSGYIPDYIKVIDIGGYLFFGNPLTDLLAYKNGIVYTLLDLYEDNIISDEQVNTIYLRYNEYQKFFCPDSIVLNYTAINESDLNFINDAWGNKFGEGAIYAESIYDIRRNNFEEYCFGWIEDVVVFRTKKTRSDDLNTFNIAGVKFSYGSPTEFWVYRDGEIFSLTDAYDMGFLTIDEIKGISKINSTV